MESDKTTSPVKAENKDGQDFDVHTLIADLKAGKLLPADKVETLCNKVEQIFRAEPNIVRLKAPLIVVGDIHGQYFDLLNIFNLAGVPGLTAPETAFPQHKDHGYLFLGDYVNRGYHSLEVITLLFLLKLLHPSKITLVRGNHECRQVAQVYGFEEEAKRKYDGNLAPLAAFCRVFDTLPIAALIDDKIFCAHAGISPSIQTLQQINDIDRFGDIPVEGAMTDLMWSDPEESDAEFQVNPRGAGYLFNSVALKKFMIENNLELFVRSHQLVMEGYKYSFPDENLLTVWSAPNYCYRCGNQASVLKLDQYLNREFVMVPPSELSTAEQKENHPHPYFL